MHTYKYKSLTRCLCVALLLCFGLASAPIAVCSASANDTTEKPMDADTARNLSFAKKYRLEGRYELARQHYLLALATTNTTNMRDIIQHELETIELQIRTLR